jgi:hypothetical protein
MGWIGERAGILIACNARSMREHSNAGTFYPCSYTSSPQPPKIDPFRTRIEIRKSISTLRETQRWGPTKLRPNIPQRNDTATRHR